MKKFQVFADDEQSIEIGELTVENGRDEVSIYGSLDVAKDKAGLKQARALKALVDGLVEALEAEKGLPEKVAATKKPKQVKNPFA